MSLTSLIRNKSPVRDKLASAFPKPRLPLKAELLVPPESENRALVGAAYDYLLRFHLAREIPFAASERWVAEIALEKLRKRSTSSGVMVGDEWSSASDIERRIQQIVNTAKAQLEELLNAETCSEALLTSALMLAHCDVLYRIGRLDARFDEKPNPIEIHELRQLLELTDFAKFRAKERCFLNPGFGIGSSRIGGADADLLIDDALIDVKCTTGLRLRVEDWRQLIGYAALNQHFPIGGGRTPVPIRRIGIYFARHGYLVVWPLRHVIDPLRFDRFSHWLANFVTERQAQRYDFQMRRYKRAAVRLRAENRERQVALQAAAAKARNRARQATQPRPSTRVRKARRRYCPEQIEWLLVAEAPPAAPDRYFYFEEVERGDGLFLETMRALYPETVRMTPSALRGNKADMLRRFQGDGFFLIDLCEAPLEAEPSKQSQLTAALPSIEHRLEQLRAKGYLYAETKIAVIGSLVHNVCHQALFDMGFNVVKHRPIEFPAFGHQRAFRRKLRALVRRFSADATS